MSNNRPVMSDAFRFVMCVRTFHARTVARYDALLLVVVVDYPAMILPGVEPGILASPNHARRLALLRGVQT